MPPVSLGWLKTVGKILAIAGSVASGMDLSKFFPDKYKPLVQRIDGTLERAHLGEIGDVVIQVESLSAALTSPLPGPEKLKAATSPVAHIMLDFLKTRHMEVDNEAEFLAGAADMASATVRIMNACKAPKV